MKIYLANSLTLAPEDFKLEMLRLRELLKLHYQVLEYYGVDGGTPADVYKHDIDCVKQCDLVLAEVTYPSTGLGIEITTALNLNKKVLAIAKKDAKISRMVLGLNDKNYKFIFYSSLDDILPLVREIN